MLLLQQLGITAQESCYTTSPLYGYEVTSVIGGGTVHAHARMHNHMQFPLSLSRS
jgi:hypothetical protein